MNVFQKKFFGLINEAPEDTIPDPTAPLPEDPAAETQAAGAAMDNPEQVDQLGAPDNPEIALKQQQTQRTIQTLTTWIGEVENFIDYLNGTDEGSINFAINSADCDSILTDIQRSESKKISRLAQDLSSLGESLKQYLLLAKRKESGADSI
jgi:hypothetical protein